MTGRDWLELVVVAIISLTVVWLLLVYVLSGGQP